MNEQEPIDTARALVAGDKGLPAMDESNSTCNKHLQGWGFPRPGRPGAPIRFAMDYI